MAKKWRCLVCGYVHTGEEAPKICPVCGVSASDFAVDEKSDVAEPEAAAREWRCITCGYVYSGTTPPDVCPVCGAGREKFAKSQQTDINIASFAKQRVVIIGAGIAGVTAAEEIRKHSAATEITVIAEEKELPYYRLNLTRYLSGEIKREELYIHSAEWYAENQIMLLAGQAAVHIDTESRKLQLSGQQIIDYDKLILAMGAHPFVPPFKGSNLKNVVTIRTIEDVDGILNTFSDIGNCVCIGGGILGIEAAGAIARNGIKVQLLESSEWLMPRQLNRSAAGMLKQNLEKLGIHVHENVRVKEIRGTEASEGVLLESGEILPAPLVVIAAGVRSNTHLARKIGLEVNQGVVVNNFMQTSNPDIFGAGDISEHHGVVYGLWSAAQYQGKIAGLNVLGAKQQFGGIPRSSVIKVLDIELFSIGDITAVDGSYNQFEKKTENQYYMFMLRDNKITGSIVIGDSETAKKVKQAIDKKADFSLSLYTKTDDILDALHRY